MDLLASPFSLSFPPIAGFAAPMGCAQTRAGLFRSMAERKGGRVALEAIDPATGVSTRSPAAPHADGARGGLRLYVGHPDPRDPFVAPTRPCATEAEAWAALAENMALSAPGELLAAPITLHKRKAVAENGAVLRVERLDRLEARALDGGVQLFIVTSVHGKDVAEQDEPRVAEHDLVARSRFYDATGRAPRVFESLGAALDFARAYKARFGGETLRRVAIAIE
jgi:hypothetical protein